jgi:hypothetical protein
VGEVAGGRSILDLRRRLRGSGPSWERREGRDRLSIALGRSSSGLDSRNLVEVDATMERRFDVFLSHNSQDKAIVLEIWKRLRARGLRPWLDEKELTPGRDWQKEIEKIVSTIGAAAVFVGANGLGPWEEPEMRACLQQFVRRRLPVIPVLLAGTEMQPELPLFLQSFTWVDLRGGLTQMGIDRLVYGITGERPLSLDLEESGEAILGREEVTTGPRERTVAEAADALDPLVSTELVPFDEPIVAFDVLPNGQGLVVCHPHGARVMASWAPCRKDRDLKFECAEANSSALSEDGALLAVADCFAEVTVYRLQDWTRVQSLRRAASRKEVRRFRAIGLRESSFEYGELTFSPDGRHLAACRQVASRDQGRTIYPHRMDPLDEPVDVYNLEGEFKYTLATGGCSPVVCFSRDSRRVLVGLDDDPDDNLAVYNTEDGTKSYSMCLNGFVRHIAAHPDGRQAVVSLAGDDQEVIRFLSIASGREMAALSYHAIPDDNRYPVAESACIDSAGDYLVSAHNCGVLRLWDVRSHELLVTWLTNPDGLWVSRLRFSSDDAYLFAALKRFPYEDTSATLAVIRMADLLKRVDRRARRAH